MKLRTQHFIAIAIAVVVQVSVGYTFLRDFTDFLGCDHKWHLHKRTFVIMVYKMFPLVECRSSRSPAQSALEYPTNDGASHCRYFSARVVIPSDIQESALEQSSELLLASN